MFDIVFEDNREIFMIQDPKTAEKINRLMRSLQSDIEKAMRESTSSQTNMSGHPNMMNYNRQKYTTTR